MKDKERNIMEQTPESAFRKLAVAERLVFGRAANIVLIARIHGPISDREIEPALKKILTKYPILGTRFQLDKDGNVWLIPAGLSGLPLAVSDKGDGQHWMRVAEEEQRYIFNYETGPMIRFTLIRSGDSALLTITCHHAIGDGLSLCFMLSDLLSFIAKPEQETGAISDPKLGADQVIPLIKRAGTIIQRIIIRLYNQKWKKSGVSFSLQDYGKLCEEYWKRINNRNKVAVIDLKGDELEALIQKCKKKQVTVNTALVTAMFADMSGKPGQNRLDIAINIRERYSVKAGRTFGSFARANRIEYDYDGTLGFWENAVRVQKLIEHKISDEEINRNPKGQILRLISPFLIDSLSFAKEGLLDNPLSNRLLRKTGFAKFSPMILTNLGKINIPEKYGRLEIEAIYGPCDFYESIEKIVGIATINNKLTITLSYNEQAINSGEALRFLKTAVSFLNSLESDDSSSTN